MDDQYYHVRKQKQFEKHLFVDQHKFGFPYENVQKKNNQKSFEVFLD